jgi:hypothetical protein
MATKKELEEQMKTLKATIKELSGKLKESLNKTTPDLGESPRLALGLFFDGEAYKVARINYNPETKSTELLGIEDASRVPHSADLAKFEVRRLLQEDIFNKLGE